MVKDPLSSYTFALEFDGVTAAYFKEGSGFDSQVEVIEHTETGKGGVDVTRKLPGRQKFSNITLKRGMTDDMGLYEWHKKVLAGDIQGSRRNGAVAVYDPNHQEVARWNFYNAWPSKWKGPDLNATNNQVALEELEIVHERLERVR